MSKSGNTIETLSNLFLLKILKKDANNIIIISENKNNFLYLLSKSNNLFFIEHKKFIGGRYSVLSEVSLLPAYLMGLNISNFRKNLSKYLNFTWDEVHDVAEQLEHVKSPKLINELDRFMDFPKKDPHGEVIPDAEGNYRTFEKVTLASLDSGTICKLISVNDGSVEFLRYVSEIGLALSSEIKVIEKRSFDNSVKIEFNDSIETVSQKFADNVFVEILSN